MDELEACFYHEVGHAYAHLLFNIPLTEVRVILQEHPEDEYPCSGGTSPPVINQPNHDPVDRIAALLAGGEAEAEYRQRHGDSGGAKGGVNDKEQIEKIKEDMRDEVEAQKAEREALHKVQDMIKNKWLVIDAIAQELSSSKELGYGDPEWSLSCDEVKAIIERVKGV